MPGRRAEWQRRMSAHLVRRNTGQEIAPMKELKDFSESEYIVWNSYNRDGGRTERLAIESYGNKRPQQRRHRTIRKQLMDEGWIRDLTPDRQGALPHIYVAVRQRVQAPAVPRKDAHISKDDFELIEGGKLVFEDIGTVMASIRKGKSWKQPRRIYDISTNEIEPLLHKIRYLKSRGMDLTLPEEHPWSQNPIFIKGLLGRTDLRGSIGIRPFGSDSDDDWNYPNLLEWYRYFKKVLGELQLVYVTFFLIKIKSVPALDKTPLK